MQDPKPNIAVITSVLNIKNMVCSCCIRVLKEDFEKAGVLVQKIRLGEVVICYDPEKTNFNIIEKIIKDCGFELIADKEKLLVEQIKLAVIELIHYYNNANSLIRNSDYLIEKLGYTYQYLSSIFSKHENITLEKYIILQKIEKVKELLDFENYTLSEISFMMGYSSVQYLSNQFKQITNVSVSDYKKNKNAERRPLNELY
ncbi:MAG: helix-turn-helix transcriptional regulator [Bacteroidales bacterium]